MEMTELTQVYYTACGVMFLVLLTMWAIALVVDLKFTRNKFLLPATVMICIPYFQFAFMWIWLGWWIHQTWFTKPYRSPNPKH